MHCSINTPVVIIAPATILVVDIECSRNGGLMATHVIGWLNPRLLGIKKLRIGNVKLRFFLPITAIKFDSDWPETQGERAIQKIKEYCQRE